MAGIRLDISELNSYSFFSLILLKDLRLKDNFSNQNDCLSVEKISSLTRVELWDGGGSLIPSYCLFQY